MPKPESEMSPSKLLLFGEYTILRGSEALSVPYTNFWGTLCFPNQQTSFATTEKAATSHAVLDKLQQYLISQPVSYLNMPALQQDIGKGMFFHANIREGYGMGSSGALVAAIYKKYTTDTEPDLATLQQRLAHIESFFHGRSSGIDPLTSYCNKPIHIIAEKPVLAQITSSPGNEYKKALIDSLTPRNTSHLVATFNDLMRHTEFNNIITHNLPNMVSQSISNLINGNNTALKASIKELSAFQLQHFRFAIPNAMEQLWAVGIKEETHFMKLCGAGGGGFFLAFVWDEVRFMSQLKKTNFTLA